MDALKLTYSLVRIAFSVSKTPRYSKGIDEDIDLFLAAEVYNLFIVVTIICLFICNGFFRIAIRERHIRELSTHLANNNALVFDTLGTDVDILRQFTPEHLLKYLEYNSGTKPIPIEQISVPFALNRDSLCISPVEGNLTSMEFSVDAISKYRIQLFWSVPSSVYKKCCKDMGKLICTKDPTFRREFLNPFLGPGDSNSNLSFSDILQYLRSNSVNGYTQVMDVDSTNHFNYSIPEQLLIELPSYHLDGNSLTIFSESRKRSSIRRMDSQTNLLRPFSRSSVYNSHQSVDPITDGRDSMTPVKQASDVLPLIIVMWNTPPPSEPSSTPSVVNQHSLSHLSFRSHNSPAAILREGTLKTDEKKPFVVKPRVERRRSTDVVDRDEENVTFVSLSIVHFLRNHVPTLIRRLNICPDGVFVPRSIYASNGDNQKNNECIICFSNPNDVVLLPCRHQLVCRFCVCMIKRCPLCRSAINYYLTEGEEKELGHSYNAESIM